MIAHSTDPTFARKRLALVIAIPNEVDVAIRTRAGTTPVPGRAHLVLEHLVTSSEVLRKSRAMHLAKGPRPLCLNALPFSASKAIGTPAEIPSVASGVDASVRARTFSAPHSQWSPHMPVVLGRVAYFIDEALVCEAYFRDRAFEGFTKHVVCCTEVVVARLAKCEVFAGRIAREDRPEREGAKVVGLHKVLRRVATELQGLPICASRKHTLSD